MEIKFEKKKIDEEITKVAVYAENDDNYGVCDSKIDGYCLM